MLLLRRCGSTPPGCSATLICQWMNSCARAPFYRCFKVGVSSNSLTLTFNYLEPRLPYEGKTFLVFAFEHERGQHEHGYRPYGGQAGLVEKGHAYNELVAAKEAGGAYSYRKLRYDDLVQRVKAFTTANQQGKANGSESFGSNTNRTLTAAGSRCSR